MKRLLGGFLLLASTALAWPNGYGYRRSITVGAAVAPGAQTAFPMLVSGTYAYLATVANGGLIQHTTTVNSQTVPADLIFTSDAAGSTALRYEVASYTATSGAIEVWVQIPSISNGTVIYMWYGNFSVSTFQGGSAGAAWNSKYSAVWHFANGSTLSLADSTANANTLTGAASPTAVAGEIDGGMGLNGSTQYASIGTVPASLVFGTNSLTISGWFKTLDTVSNEDLVATIPSGGHAGVRSFIQGATNGFLSLRVSDGTNNFSTISSSSVATGVWNYFAVTVDRTANNLTGYINGTAFGPASIAGLGSLTSTGWFQIGADTNGSADFVIGTMDEVHVLNGTVLSQNWITTEYNNQSSPSTFYAIGPAMSMASTGAGLAIIVM